MLAEATLLVALTVERGPGAESCLEEAKLRRGVEKRLRRRVFADPAEAQLRFVVTYTARGGETEARIDVSSIDGTPRGTRTLVTSSHCSSLDDSLALSVALLADQPPEPEPMEASVAAAPPERAPDAAPRLEPWPAATTPITIPPDVASPREPWHAAVGVAVQGAWGVLPGIGPAAVGHVRLVPPHFVPTTLSGEAFASRTAERDSSSGARFHLLRIGLSLCPPVHRGPGRELAMCFGQKVGWLRVDGFGFDRDTSERRLTYALHAGLEARQSLFSIFAVRGMLGVEAPLVRDRFVSLGRNATELFRSTFIAFAAQVGVEASLW